jgi:protein-L-isoaspartate(D-aspartate) O-methyltransferase
MRFKIMNKFVNDLIKNGYLKNDLIIDAFSSVDRIEFVLPEYEKDAYANIPLPIGYGQTISQPMTVAIMLELLDPQRGQNILDVGSGSGWTTALLSYIVGEKGKVTAIERKEELVEFGKKNADKLGFVKNKIAEFVTGDGREGYLEHAPYDRILVSASADCIPNALKEQLKVGGKMVIPVLNSLWYLEKKGENDFKKEEYGGFTFVPLID